MEEVNGCGSQWVLESITTVFDDMDALNDPLCQGAQHYCRSDACCDYISRKVLYGIPKKKRRYFIEGFENEKAREALYGE